MTNGGKKKSVAFIILFSVATKLYIHTFECNFTQQRLVSNFLHIKFMVTCNTILKAKEGQVKIIFCGNQHCVSSAVD